jgi:hypothetical protein
MSFAGISAGRVVLLMAVIVIATKLSPKFLLFDCPTLYPSFRGTSWSEERFRQRSFLPPFSRLVWNRLNWKM